MDGKSKLVHITTIPNTLWFLDGQPSYMAERGFEVHAISSPGQMLADFGKEQNVQVHAVLMSRRITPIKDMVSLWKIWRIIRSIKPKIVHAHTPKAGLLGMIAAYLAGVPVRIYHIHGLPFMTAKGFRKIILKYAERLSCLLACEVLCVSRSIRDIVTKYKLCSPEKAKVLCSGSANGIDSSIKYNPARIHRNVVISLRKSLGIQPKSHTIGFVGRIARDKGVIELADAWKILRKDFPNLHLVIAGAPEPHDPIPDELMKDLHCDPRVHMMGRVDRNFMPVVYSALDVLVLPTYREGFGNVAIEAAAMEIPIVATNVPGVVDAVKNGVTGTLVPPYSAAELAKAIRRYLLDPNLRAKHGQAGRKRVMTDFRPEFIQSELFEEYMTLLERFICTTQSTIWKTFYQVSKRVFDILAAILIGTALMPLMLIIAAAIRITMGSPIFYKEHRPGKDEKLFTILKFRSMTNNFDSNGKLLPDSKRLTYLGKLLRKTSLDELPQLWNVLKGDMSLVGPRPLKTDYLPFYTLRERLRHKVRPGITGLAQVSGRNMLGWDERLEKDVFYIEHQGFLIDTKIILLTLLQCVFGKNVAEVPGELLKPLNVVRSLSPKCRESGGRQ